MNYLFFIIYLLVFPFAFSAESATITAVNGGGNWSATSTWVGGAVPDLGVDTVIIPNTLTAAVVLDDSRTIPPTTIEDEVYGLVQGSSVTTTLGGILTVGNGSAKDGKFTFGAGSSLALGSNNLVLNNCILTSNAVSESWATITGTAGIVTGVVYTAPKQSTVLTYISFQNTGAIQFASGGASGGTITNQITVSRCTFNGADASNILFGQAGWTPSSSHVLVEYNDFRTVGHIYLHGADVTTGSSVFRFNTVENLTMKSVVAQRTNSVISGNILKNCDIGATQVATKGGHQYINNLLNITSADSILLSDTTAAQTVQGNYIYSTSPNPHGIRTFGTGGYGIHDISWNVFETVYNADGGNYTYTALLPTNVHNNLIIGSGTLCNNLIGGTRAEYNCYNNTTYSTYNDIANGQLFIAETNVSTAGSINLYNNLVTGSIAIARGVKNLAAGTQPLGKVGNNNFWNITTPYVAVGTEITISTDNTGLDHNINPFFVDTSRNLGKWGELYLSSDGTAADALAKLLSNNGYNSSTKKQSDTAINATIKGSSSSLVDYVMAGFAPTSASLKTSGDGGTYIGAMDITESGNHSALLMGL